MRARWLLLVCLVGCAPERKADPVLARFDRPVTLTLRRHEVRTRPACEEKGFDVYKCWFQKREVFGCIYLDVGKPYDDPEGENPCNDARAGRLFVAQDPREKVELAVDEQGSRFAWRGRHGWTVVYWFEGTALLSDWARTAQNPNSAAIAHVLGTGPAIDPMFDFSPAGPIHWESQPTLDQAIPKVYFTAPADVQPALLTRLRAKGGDAAVKAMLEGESNLLATGWEEAFSTLPAAAQREVGAGAVERAYTDVTDPAVNWLDEHPELMPKDFEERLAKQAQLALDLGELDRAQQWLTRGLQHHVPSVGRLACELITQNHLLETWNEAATYGDSPYYQDSSAFLAIGATHTRCPAVTELFGSVACAPDLRCGHPPPDDEATTDPAPAASERTLAPASELCTAADVKKALATAADDESADIDENLDPAARMAALLAQGPLPPAFVLADQRMHYALDRPKPDPDNYPDPTTPCAAEPDSVADLMCHLKPEQTRFSLAGCRVEVDDAKRVVHLRPVEEPDAG